MKACFSLKKMFGSSRLAVESKSADMVTAAHANEDHGDNHGSQQTNREEGARDSNSLSDNCPCFR